LLAFLINGEGEYGGGKRRAGTGSVFAEDFERRKTGLKKKDLTRGYIKLVPPIVEGEPELQKGNSG